MSQHHQHLLPIFLVGHNTAIWPLVQEIEKAVRGMAVMPRVRQQTELTVQEDDCVSSLEEVLGGRGTSRSGAEVVDEADGLPFEGHGSSAGCYEDDASACCGVVVDKLAGERGVLVEGGGRRVFVEVVVFCDFRCALACELWSGRHCGL